MKRMSKTKEDYKEKHKKKWNGKRKEQIGIEYSNSGRTREEKKNQGE